jgi:hypothetical protein
MSFLMRLSYTPISLLHFFLITFLTLFLKIDAKAQSMLAVNSSRHHFEHDRSFVPVVDNDHSEPIPEKYDGSLLNEGHPASVNFLHNQAALLPTKNQERIYTGYHPLRVRIYSASIQNSMRVTVKLFKVVIVPLWYSK